MENLTHEQTVQLSTLKSKLQSIPHDIKSIVEQGRLIQTDPSQLFLFKGMYKELNSYFNIFNNTWDKLTEFYCDVKISNVFPSKNDTALQQCVKKYYYDACAIYESHMNPTPVASSDETHARLNGSLNETRTVRARLPQINLPQFNGNQSDWPIFRDTFLSLIHEECTLSNIEKFHFLISCLRGPALTIVKGVSLTADNYEQAWKLLNENYNDKRRLASNYLQVLLNFAPFRSRPTSASLKYLLTTVIEGIESFRHLKINNAHDFILLYLLLRCLDPATKRAFEKEVSNVEFPALDDLIDFLKIEWKTLDLSSEEGQGQSTHNSKYGNSAQRNKHFNASLLVENDKSSSFSKHIHTKVSSGTHSFVKYSCPVCKTAHSLYQCDRFKASPANEKRASLRNWNGCCNCLSGKHTTDTCTSTRRCQTCNMKHHTWLHIPVLPEITTSAGPNQQMALSGTSYSSGAILATALIEIKDSQGYFQTIRAVMDPGSQLSFITKDCVERLGYSFVPNVSSALGIGQVPVTNSYGHITCTLRSRYDKDEFGAHATVIKNIAGDLPQATLPSQLCIQYNAYELADPTYWKPQRIDFLLATDIYYDLITGGPIDFGADYPKLVPSKLGYLVAGRCRIPPNTAKSVSLLVQDTNDLTRIMTRFWECEEVPKSSPLSKEENECEQHFKSTHYRLPSGRYVVSLPFKSSNGTLISPRHQAIRRQMNLEHKLSHNPLLKMEYHKYMREYLTLGHMQPTSSPGRYVIPHHCVTKIEDGKSKIRVVFDASCSSSTGSLNDHLMVGPKLQKDISDILLTFRTFSVVIVADIVKMYRQVVVRPEDRPFQHIMWRFDPKETLQEMELTTVTQGEASSNFLAVRTLLQLVMDEGHKYPLASQVLKDSVHVDDIVSGAGSLEEALCLQQELIDLMKLGGFELSKWKSNCHEILHRDQDHNEEKNLSLVKNEDDASHKILGLEWNSSADVFTFKVHKPTSPPTKRGILSAIARIYDPLGFLAPVVFKAKTLLQDVWKAKCDWDEMVPPNIASCWSSFANELDTLSEVLIPRLVCLQNPISYGIVGYSDASQRGYSATIYLRVSYTDACKVHLLKAKTKLAPTKLVSIPRLELCGAVLLVRLFNSCQTIIHKLNVQEVHFFTDSTVVLGWLNLPTNKLKAFVAHRVTEILESTQVSQWHHIPTESNPADCASRGLMPNELKGHTMWWTGPDWLSNSSSEWFNSSLPDLSFDLPETKPNNDIVLLVQGSEDLPCLLQWMSRSSSYLKLIRSLCYALRFVKVTRKQGNFTSIISLKEINEANIVCIKIIQHFYFTSDKQVCQSKYWKSLAPFRDSRGLFRVGGRLQHSNLAYSVKHPIILPNCHFTRLLVDYYHKIHLHIGPSSLQAMIQARYHLCSGRKLIRSRIRHCVKCQITTSRPQPPYMGDLPACRLQEGQIFQNVGIDLGGPFPLKESHRPKAALGKAYLCLFICMVTKAIHLEVVSSCSTEAFIAALYRFISRRGKPLHIYSDCGTNFVGAASALKDLKKWYMSKGTQNQIYNYNAEQQIQWHFNPPRSPHFGGIWEAGIKSSKALLARNMSNTPLTFEELSTLFSRIEAVLNSRPLCPMNALEESIECLTPGHFLIGRPITSLPEQSVMNCKENTLRRWQLIQHRVQHFWSRWRLDYLNQLQQRRKWTTHRSNMKEGDIVIIKDTDSPPTLWPLARVRDTHPGQDGIVRVVTIQTPKGVYKRPVVKLVPLNLPNHNL